MKEEQLGTKCPRCGHEWREPDWRCPECYYEFGTPLEPSGKKAKHTPPPSEDEKRLVIRDQPTHEVANPQRAMDKHSKQFTRRGLARIANVLILPAAGLMALAIGASDNSEGLTIAGFVMLAIGGVTAIVMGQLQKGLELIQEGRRHPKMTSPEDTLDTFFRAMCRPGLGPDDRPDCFYGRAYNCLTDTAQRKAGSLEDFKNHWDNLGYGWAPDRANMQRRGVSDSKQTVSVAVHIHTSRSQKGTSELLRDQFDEYLVLVERGGFWFMTDGAFLPSEKAQQDKFSVRGKPRR